LNMLPKKCFLVSAYSILRKRSSMKATIDLITRRRDEIDMLWVDSGLISAITNGDTEWVEHQEDVAKLADALGADLVTMMDCPLYERLLARCNWTPEQMYKRTIENAKEFLEIETKATKVFGLQGYKGPEHYVECLKTYEKIGVLDGKNWIGIGGSMARSRKMKHKVAELVCEYIRNSRAPNTHVHFFGIADPNDVVDLYFKGVESVDNLGPMVATIHNRWYTPEGRLIQAVCESKRPPELMKAQLYWNFNCYLVAIGSKFKERQS